MSPRELRFERNQRHFRIVNERIAEITADWGGNELSVICECANTGCAARLEIPLDQYDAIRQHPAWYIVAPGHASPRGLEEVLERHGAYDIVEVSSDSVVVPS
jgi:hypothetical protein